MFKSIGAKITGTFAKQVFVVKENSPVLLAGVGIVGVVATAVLASRATLKTATLLAETEENLAEVETEGKDAKEIEKSVFSAQVRTAITIAKFYAPAVVMGTATVIAFASSVKILRGRNAAISAAFAATNASYSRYRERVIADQGEGKDREYMYGGEEVEIVEEGPNGPETKTVTAVDLEDIRNGKNGSPYVKVFDEWNRNFNRNIPQRNSDFLANQMMWANDMLLSKGHVLLNDVYELLGFEKTAAGMRVGWVKGASTGDNHVSFTAWGNGIKDTKEWIIRGAMDPIVLDFNVDGDISEHFAKF
jgi:hypothetical protein